MCGEGRVGEGGGVVWVRGGAGGALKKTLNYILSRPSIPIYEDGCDLVDPGVPLCSVLRLPGDLHGCKQAVPAGGAALSAAGSDYLRVYQKKPR